MREGYSTWSVSVCVQQHESSHYAQLSVQLKVPTALVQSGKHFKYGVFSFVQKLWRHLHTWQRQIISRHPISTEPPTVAKKLNVGLAIPRTRSNVT